MALIKRFENDLLIMSIQDDRVLSCTRKRNPFFLFPMNCRLDVSAGEKHWLLDKEDFLIFNRESPFQYEMEGKGIACIMEMKEGVASKYLELSRKKIHCSSFMHNSGTDKVRQLVYRIANLILDDGHGDEALLYSSFYQMLYYLHENFLVDREIPDTGSGRDDTERMHQIQDYIREHYNEPITLQDLSEETYLSKAYLSKYIKKKFGANLTEILGQVRLERALDDVRSTSYTFTKIALDHGFANVSSFNRIFQEKYHMQPSEYRKKYLQTGEEKKKPSDDILDKKYRDYFRQVGFSAGVQQEVPLLKTQVSDATTFSRFWSRMINGCRAEQLLQAEMQRHLLLLKNELHFQAVRIWDIYSPEMMMFDGDKSHGYNFSKLDTVLDFLSRNGIAPYIELGFKPVLLLQNIADYMVRKNRDVWFDNVEEYGDFLDQFFRHLLTRYGIEEVNKWYFEQWRDTRLPDFDAYIRIFETLYTKAKHYSPHIRVGGGGFHNENTTDLEKVIKIWKTRYCYPDFVSLYGYPYTTRRIDEFTDDADLENYLSRDDDYLRHELERAGQIMKENGFGNLELHLSEWSLTVSDRAILNDTVFKGAYMVKNMLDMVGLVDLAGYWFGSDLNSEYYDTRKLLTGSNGTICKMGVRKPSYFAFDFFERLEPYLLAKNDDMIITTNLHDSYSVVCHNYCRLNSRYYQAAGKGVTVQNYTEFFDGKDKTVRFRISGVENGTYQIKTRTVSEKIGNVMNEWREMEFADNLNDQDVSYLRQVCVPRIRIRTVKVTGHSLEYQVRLTPNEIENIHIYRLL